MKFVRWLRWYLNEDTPLDPTIHRAIARYHNWCADRAGANQGVKLMNLKLNTDRVRVLRPLLEKAASSDPDVEVRRIARGLVFSIDYEMRKADRAMRPKNNPPPSRGPAFAEEIRKNE